MLNQEWLDRLTDWQECLKEHIYIDLGGVDVEGFTTFEHMSADEAGKRPFKKYQPGELWGRKWEYAWFRGNITLPEKAENHNIVVLLDIAQRPDYMRNELVIDTGTDSLVYVNGKEAGCTRSLWYKSSIMYYNRFNLTNCAKAGEKFEIMAECYGGHGGAPTAVGPVSWGREPYGEPPEFQNVMGNVRYGIWDEDAYGLYMDVKTLTELRNNLEENSLRLSLIDDGLKKFMTLVDFEVPYEDMIKTFKETREILKPLLQCKNGSTAPTLYAFGHAHIDVAWLWKKEETRRKCARTFANQLMLLEKYPDYKFMQSSPWIYEAVKEYYPELYERVLKAIKDGSIIADGGMWVEADTNITGGESLIRQFLYGKKFFKEELGTDSEMLWLPDVFGYSANMPQIMKGCGIKYFSTSKLGWRYHGGDPFPYTTFMWEGIDGSDIITHLCPGYASSATPNSVCGTWNLRVQKDNISSMLLPFGFGDGGGGPTCEHLEYVEREKNLEGMPIVKMDTPLEFFRKYEGKDVSERYVGELYFQAHRGTYTSQAKTKKLNRKCEFALRDAEMLCTFANIYNNREYPLKDFEKMWKKMLVNQFHDVIPGSSIKEVYKEANEEYKEVLKDASNYKNSAASTFVKTGEIQEVTFFNTLSWNRRELIEGKFVDIPAMGYITVNKNMLDELPEENNVEVTESSIENEYIKVIVNASGEIESVYDKEWGREFLSGVGNRFELYKDVPTRNDAWDIDSMYTEMPCKDEEVISREIVYNGIRVTKRINNSYITQKISVNPKSRRVDFETEADWQESHKLLKVCFPLNVHSNEALYDIQFGYYKRPNYFNRQYDRDRFEVCAHKWTALTEDCCGAAVINDCKYGVNTLGENINLTLLKAPMAPDKECDRGKHSFKYALYIWNGGFADSRLIKEAYEFNTEVVAVVGRSAETEMYESGRSFVTVDSKNIIVETVKMADDRSGDVILRLYQPIAARETAAIETDFEFKNAVLVNMIEEEKEPIICINGKVELDFGPFEVKTVRFKL